MKINNKIITTKTALAALVVIIFVILAIYTDLTFTAEGNKILHPESKFEIHFIDVGQADASLILCDGMAMLIDGGNIKDSDLIYTYLRKYNIKHIDYIVATHIHEDHIGGLSGALNFATVGTAFCPVDDVDNEFFIKFKNNVQKSGISITVPEMGDIFELGSSQVQVLCCNSDNQNINDTSIVLKIIYGKTSFLFTGDAERHTEQFILENGFDVSSTVLKVAHHGSDSSTTYPFLRDVLPEYAVISVGEDNPYFHPSYNVLKRLDDAGVTVFRTDLHGDIICRSDGQNVTFNVDNYDN